MFASYPRFPSIGKIEWKVFDPERWVPEYPNPAFLNRLPDDEFWGAADALLLEATLDSMPYGFSIWDGEERLVLWNRRYVEIYDLPADRLTQGMALAEVCEITIAAGTMPAPGQPSSTPNTGSGCGNRPARRPPSVFEKRIRDRTIKTTYMHLPGLGCVVTHEDVTEQVLHERELETQNLRFDAALNSMAHGFSILDQQFRLVLWNRQFAEMYGLGEEVALAGPSLTDFILAGIEVGHFPGQIASEMSRRYRRELAALDEDATFVSDEVLSSGRSVRVSYRRMPDLSFVATHEDITDEKDHLNALRQRESELAHQNMRFAAAVENMSQGLCMFDRDQKLIICNSRYADLYRCPASWSSPARRCKRSCATGSSAASIR